ncbi:MAG TPA: PQQ-binding-like beta-propeller repeat protein [Gemmatimonadaceae bacterium]|nr:PQQ-binding-like beta-propeller repeat protein [Gemmatimonadaceae bacterium]
MRRRDEDTLFIGIGGCVVALDPATGEERWRTKVKGATYITIARAGERVLAGANGELFCLDASNGAVLWHNKLKGLGMGLISFGCSGEVAAAAAARAAAAAAGAAAT